MDSCISTQASAADLLFSSLGQVVPHDAALAFARTACDNMRDTMANELAGSGRTVLATVTDTTEVADALDVFFVLFSTCLVFVMQAGFAMLSAGSIRQKNTINILLKNVADVTVAGISFYLLGFGFAYGTSESGGNAFIGNSDFALSSTAHTGGYHIWLFQWAFASAAATIVSGCMAERVTFTAYLVYSMFLTAFAYPVAAHWVWSSSGWLSAASTDRLLAMGMVDFAGCSVIHMLGGLAGLMGAILLGPRIGRFDANGNPVDMPGHSVTLVVLGTFLLWFGWYGFNPGSAMSISTTSQTLVVELAAITTTLSGCAGGVVSLFYFHWKTRVWDAVALCNGVLCGLVAVTAACACIEPWAAIVIGAFSPLVFDACETLRMRFLIDDPLSASSMHAGCGLYGALTVGVFARRDLLLRSLGRALEDYEDSHTPQGLVYGGNGRLLLCQAIGLLTIAAWIVLWMGLLFKSLSLLGVLRVDASVETAGLDISKHGGHAYEGMLDVEGQSRKRTASEAQGRTVRHGAAAPINSVVPADIPTTVTAWLPEP